MPDRSVNYTFKGTFTNLTAGLTTAGRNVAELGTKLTALDRNGQKMRAGLTQIGTTAGRIGIAAAAGVAAVVLSAANFDQSMSRVQAATGATTDGLDDLRAAAIKAGAATVFSASEAADAITAMSKAGVSANDILSGGLTGALNLASAGELDVAQAADIAATAMNQFGLAGKDIPHIADLLAEGAASAQGEVTDFATALKYVGPVAHQMGISIEETTGVIAELASQGVLADQAGTSLRGMLTALTSPSTMAAKEMKTLGVNLYDASGQFVGFDGVAEQLHSTLGGLTNAERDQALGRIFGNEQITAARILYAGGADAVAKWTDAVDKDGAAADIAATKLNNLKGDLEQLRGSLETAFIGAGGGTQGPLRTLVQDTTSVVNAFNKLPGPIQSSVTALGGVTAVTGGSLWFGAKVVSGIASTNQALKDLGETGVRLRGVLKGVGLAAGSLAVLDIVGASVTALETKFDRAVPSTDALTKSLLDLGNAQTAQSLSQDLGDLGDAVDRLNAGGLTGVTDKLANMANEGGLLGNTLKGANLLTGNLGLSSAQKDLREYAKSIDAVDAALANIAATGSPDQARDAFAALAAAQGLSKDQQAELLDLMPKYSDALDGAANQATLTGTATSGLSVDTTGLGTAAGDAAQQITDLVKSMKDQKDAAVAAFDAITGYRQAMKDADAQAKKSNAGIAGNSDEVLKNRDALSGLIAHWNSLDDTVTDNIGKFKAARDNFIATAVAMGVPRKAAEQLWQEMAKIPTSKVIPVTADTGQAVGAINQVSTMLRNLNGDTATTFVRTVRTDIPLPGASADGGTVPKTGRPYADRHHYLLADGEEVISNRHGQADRHRSLLKAINAGRLADGGTAAGSHHRHLDPVYTSAPPGLEALFGAAANAAGALAVLGKAVDRAKESVNNETQARDQVVDAMASLSSSVTSGLRSQLFTQSGNPWAASLGAVASTNATLQSDISRAQMFASLEQQLLARGLHGAALQSLIEQAAQNGGDVGLLQQFATASAGDLSTYQSSYDVRDQITAATGQGVANDLLGGQLAAANAKLEGVRDDLHEANQRLHQLEQAVKTADEHNQQGHNGTQAATAASGNGKSPHSAGWGRRAVGPW